MISIILPTHKEPKPKKALMHLATKKEFPSAEIIQIDDSKSRGKGYAIREGFRKAKGDPICYIDGDFDIHPKMLKRLLLFIDEYDIVVGKKKIEGLFYRKIITFLSRLYIKVLFGIPVETQTGIKVYRRSVIPEWKINGYTFDIEMLAKAKKSGCKMIEVPITATIRKNVPIKVLVKTFIDSLRIKLFLLF